MAGREACSITIGTFHSICLELLKKSELDAPVLPEEDALLLGEQIVHQFGLKLSPAGFLRRVSSIKNGALPATSLPQKALDAYADLLDYYGVMDYDDILLRAIEHLKSQSANAKQQLHAFSHLLVDEFQDINPLQYCFIRLIKDAGASGDFASGIQINLSMDFAAQMRHALPALPKITRILCKLLCGKTIVLNAGNSLAPLGQSYRRNRYRPPVPRALKCRLCRRKVPYPKGSDLAD